MAKDHCLWGALDLGAITGEGVERGLGDKSNNS